MTLLHTMSLTGGIAVANYLLLYVFTNQHLSLLWHKAYLTITIFLFVTPLARLKFVYVVWADKIWGLKTWYQENNTVKNLSDFSIQIYENGIRAHNWWIYVFLAGCLMVSVIILIRSVVKYIMVSRSVMNTSNEMECIQRILSPISQKINLRAKTKVYVSGNVVTPVTIGLIHRKIVLPDTDMSEECIEDTLYHELIHIKCMDNLTKLVLLAVIILNFYNPFVYYLWYKWNLVSEMYCDSRVIADMDIKERKTYANLIIDFAEEKNAGFLPIVGLNMGYNIGQKQLKERIKRMKNTGKKYGNINRIAGGVILLASVVLSSLTVYAYEPRQIRYYDEEIDDSQVEEWFMDDEMMVPYEQDLAWKEYEKYITADTEQFFVDASGNVSFDIYTEEEIGRISCNHTYSNGTFARHTKNRDGSCKVDYYEGMKCTKCGNVTYGDYISTTSYAVCPH